jgi:prepilin-type N-terminal cleavage/methylation domain-containing protein
MTLGVNNKKGFTLIEVIVVIVIMGILAAIVAPNFSGYIHKLHVKEIVRQAKAMNDELSVLVGRQYAEFGYMPSVCHSGFTVNGSALALGSGSETVDQKNYVMLNRVNDGAFTYCNGYLTPENTSPNAGGAYTFRVEYVTLANVQTGRVGGSNTPSELAKLRQSAGLTEFYKQTGIDLSGNAERTPGSGGDNSGNSEMERRWYAIQFYSRSDIASEGSSPYLTTKYLHPDQSYFGFFFVKYNDKWYMVMHDAKYPSGTWNHGDAPGIYSAWVGRNTPAKDKGKWNVYEAVDNTHFAYITLDAAGTPFGTISD